MPRRPYDDRGEMDADLRRLVGALEHVLLMKPDNAIIPVVARDLRVLLAAINPKPL